MLNVVNLPRLPWDSWTASSIPICSSIEQIFKIESNYINISEIDESRLFETTGCPRPCSFYRYRLVDDPQLNAGIGYGFQLRYGKAEANEEREIFLYDFTSFVSEFGGALGLFLGFSFFSLWDIIQPIIIFLNKRK